MAVCVSSQFAVSPSGELEIVPCQFGLRQRVVFSTPGVTTFNKADYPGLCRVFIQAQGGGGGSAGCDAAAGQCVARPGGAGGAYAEVLVNASSLGTSESVTVGAGGTAGSVVSNGGAGGTSSFGGFAVAPGGDGGTAFMVTGTTPDTSSGIAGAGVGGAVGSVVIGGGASGGALRLSATAGLSGAGGDSHLGFGGFPRGTEGDGALGRGYGGGASGAISYGGGAIGEVGQQGIVIVWLYF